MPGWSVNHIKIMWLNICSEVIKSTSCIHIFWYQKIIFDIIHHDQGRKNNSYCDWCALLIATSFAMRINRANEHKDGCDVVISTLISFSEKLDKTFQNSWQLKGICQMCYLRLHLCLNSGDWQHNILQWIGNRLDDIALLRRLDKMIIAMFDVMISNGVDLHRKKSGFIGKKSLG